MRYAYYPGCSLHSTGIEYDISTRLVAKHLGLELWEIPDWNCCGASAAHNQNHLLALSLPARNLALAEQEGLDLAVPCAACFSRLKAAQRAVGGSEEMRRQVNQVIEMEYRNSNQVYALLDLIVNRVGLEAIAAKVVRPLGGLKVASYYGCLLVRPPQITGFDDPEDPQTMDRLVTALGGQPLAWGGKTWCCGAGHSTTRTDIAQSMINKIYADAQANGAELMIAACPLCLLNLDMRQAVIEERFHNNYNLPVLYFTELLGLALGYAPKDLGVTRHFVNPVPLLERKEVLRHPSARSETA